MPLSIRDLADGLSAGLNRLLHPAGDSIACQLRAMGAVSLPRAPVQLSREPTVLATIDSSNSKGFALFSVEFDVAVEADGVRLQTRAGDGSVIDEMMVGPGGARLALFATLGRTSLVARNREGRVAKAKVSNLALYGFPAERLEPARLARIGDLKRPFDWSNGYGEPASHDVGGRLRNRAFRLLTKPLPAPTPGGLQVLLEPGDELSRALFVTGFYEPDVMAAVQAHLPKGGVFVDGGAHCGLFTLLASRRVGPKGAVLAFEPSAREYARLAANIALNSLANVTASDAALAEVAGQAVMRQAEAGHAGHNTLGAAFAYPAVRLAASPEVPTIALDDALRARGLDRCDVIKLDINGSELRALKGAAGTLERARPLVLLGLFGRALEAHGATVDELVAWLDAHGYVLRDIDPHTGRILPVWSPDPGASKMVAAIPKA